MRSKSYIENTVEKAKEMSDALQRDIENNRPYVDKQYLHDRLEFIKQNLILALDRLQLEDENR